MGKDDDVTASDHGSSLIGCADVVKKASRRQLKKAQRACDLWNAANPVGSSVSVHSLRHGFCGPITRTFCKAWIVDGEAVVMIEGFGLPMQLELIKPRGLSASEAPTSAEAVTQTPSEDIP